MSTTNNIGYLLNHLAFVLSRQSDQVLQEQLGIGFSQYKIMMVLMSNPSIQQKQIAERLGQTESSVSRQIKLLQDKSLLVTRITPENRREHITKLTLKGEKLTEQAMLILNNYHASTLDALSEKQHQQLLEILNVMHDHVHNEEIGMDSHHSQI